MEALYDFDCIDHRVGCNFEQETVTAVIVLVVVENYRHYKCGYLCSHTSSSSDQNYQQYCLLLHGKDEEEERDVEKYYRYQRHTVQPKIQRMTETVLAYDGFDRSMGLDMCCASHLLHHDDDDKSVKRLAF